MKRITIGVVVAAMLAAAGTAFAAGALNTYKATYSFHSSGKALSFKQVISAKSTTAGNRTALLHLIKTTISGVKINEPNSAADECTAATIDHLQSDASCPKKALVASGSITASVGPSSPFQASNGQACDPLLHVWNAGPGKLSFFFVDTASHECYQGQIHTGQVPVFPATYSQAGSKTAISIPIPDTVDYPAGQSANLTGSLESETLNWVSQTIGGKPTITSTSCSGKRSYSWSFTASLPNGANSVSTTKGSSSCG